MATTTRPTLPPIMTLPEAAEYYRVSERKMWEMVRRDEVPHFRLGRQIRFNRARLEQDVREREGK